MHVYGIYEAKTKLPELIKQVQRGERVTITNRAGQQTQEAIAAIKTMRAGMIDQEQFLAMRQRGRR